MTLDEEIMLAKQEKVFASRVDSFMKSLKEEWQVPQKNVGSVLKESEDKLLNYKYSKTAEMLREAKYFEKVDQLSREGISNLFEGYLLSKLTGIPLETIQGSKSSFYRTLITLRTGISNAIALTESDTLATLLEAYENLSEFYSFLFE